MPVVWFASVALATELGPARWVDEAELRPGSYLLAASDTLAFPLLDGERLVGVALVGDLAFTFPFAQKGEALARGVADLSWSEPSSVAVWFSSDVAWLDAYPPVDDSRGALGWEDDEGWHVVVHGWGLDESRRRANAAENASSQWFGSLGIDPTVMRARDDLRGGTPRQLLALETRRAVSGRELLGWAFDPTGAIDTRRQEVIFVGERSVLTGSSVAPGERVDVASGVANAVVSDGAASHHVAIDALIRVSAPVATSSLPLCEPAAPVVEIVGLRTTPLIRQDLVFTAGDQPLVDLGPAWGWLGPECADAHDWQLATPLPPSSVVSVRATWHEHWASAHPLDALEYYAWSLRQFGNCKGPIECGREAAKIRVGWIDLGHASVDHAVLPIQPFQPGTFPAELRVGTLLPERWVAVIGGVHPEKRVVGDARWWIGGGARSDTRVGFGAWTLEADEPMLGFPGVQVAMLGSGIGADPVQVRAILNFYQDALPDWPLAEFSVVEGPSFPTAALHGQRRTPGGSSSPGVWSVEPVSVITLDGTGFSDSSSSLELSLAHAVVSGWWDTLSWGREERWLRDALVAFYVARFAEARGIGFEASGLVAALDGGLGARVGQDELLRGFERFFTEPGPPTVERLSAVLGVSCGSSAVDFLDTFVVGGLTPAVTGSWSTGKGHTTVRLAADPPLGRYELPVTVRRGRGVARTLWVPMRDGAGVVTFEGAVESMAIDESHAFPLTRRALTEE